MKEKMKIRGQMKIGIDLDDVIVNFFPSFLEFYNRQYEKNFDIKNMSSYHIWEVGIGKNNFVYKESGGAEYDRDLSVAKKHFEDKLWILVDDSQASTKKAPKTTKGGDTKRSLTKAIEGLELLESFGSLDANEMAELKDLRERLDKLTKK